MKQGDRAAAATLYKWYGDRLFRQAILPRLPIPELAEDVLKDTFKTTLEKIEQYQIRDRSIFYWMRRIAINRAMDVHRAYQRQRKMENNASPELIMAHPPPAPDRSTEVEETQQLVQKSLAMLNPRYQKALTLRLLEDKDREECAQELGVTLGNFDVILHRASAAFRKVFPP